MTLTTHKRLALRIESTRIDDGRIGIVSPVLSIARQRRLVRSNVLFPWTVARLASDAELNGI